MRPIKSGARIILLDACRDNKFKSFVRSGTRGLAEMRAITGTIIGYATGPGEVALDGRGNNSPFAEALAETIKVPNLDIEQVLKKARILVREGTNNRQTPWASSSLTGDFYFVRN